MDDSRKNRLLVLKPRRVVTLLARTQRLEGHKGNLQHANNILFLELHADYTDIFIL